MTNTTALNMCIGKLRESLSKIADFFEDHPEFIIDATQEDIEHIGGDAANFTYYAQEARKTISEVDAILKVHHD